MSTEEDSMLNSREAFSEEENIASAFNAINECLQSISKRLEQLENKVEELPTPDKYYYRPQGQEEYISLNRNLDLIYEKISKMDGIFHVE